VRSYERHQAPTELRILDISRMLTDGKSFVKAYDEPAPARGMAPRYQKQPVEARARAKWTRGPAASRPVAAALVGGAPSPTLRFSTLHPPAAFVVPDASLSL
jgi:hypothetical protein